MILYVCNSPTVTRNSGRCECARKRRRASGTGAKPEPAAATAMWCCTSRLDTSPSVDEASDARRSIARALATAANGRG